MKTEIESVELIASGYEWTCPACDHFNKVVETSETVTCNKCGKEFEVADYHHANP